MHGRSPMVSRRLPVRWMSSDPLQRLQGVDRFELAAELPPDLFD